MLIYSRPFLGNVVDIFLGLLQTRENIKIMSTIIEMIMKLPKTDGKKLGV
eukprot:UN25862